MGDAKRRGSLEDRIQQSLERTAEDRAAKEAATLEARQNLACEQAMYKVRNTWEAMNNLLARASFSTTGREIVCEQVPKQLARIRAEIAEWPRPIKLDKQRCIDEIKLAEEYVAFFPELQELVVQHARQPGRNNSPSRGAMGIIGLAFALSIAAPPPGYRLR